MLKKLKKIVKDLLAIKAIRNAYTSTNKFLLTVFGSNRLIATFYTIISFATFNREQYAVLRGRRNYYKNLNKKRSFHVELRRNIHRLEKGIIMQPRKPVFAKDYLSETIDFYQEAVRQYEYNQDSIDVSELEWAHDVLVKYFSIVSKNDAVVSLARQRFDDTLSTFSRSPKDSKSPFVHKDAKKSNVTYEDMLALAVQRRSVRWFKDKKVSRKLIDKALLVGRQSPTACNRLPYEFRIFDDEKMVKKVAGIPFGAGGYAHQIPTIIVVVGKLDSYFSARDRHAIYVDSSLAAMSFMYGLETLGLSSTVINWPDFEPLEAKMQKTLNLDVSERVIMLIAVGYAQDTGEIPYSQKKSLDVLRNYNSLKD